ncbi:MAG: carbamoyltransferase [Candidatus Pacebacteria bacterium]|nr:carbamoyltransferase [Candidatus Paceibacterota bacterium]
MIILGISCYYHDSAACIIKDGKIIAAAAEERFTRIKHDNSFPKESINFCLDSLKISANEVDVVTFYEKPLIKFERLISQHLENFPKSYSQFTKYIGPWFNSRLQIKKTLEEEVNYFGKVTYVDHHLSHSASSYFLSPFNKSVVINIDGVGEWATTTVGIANKGEIKIDKEIHFPHSIGLLYSTLTTYLGFSANNSEYKVMGLAAYGNPKTYKKHFEKIIKLFPDGSFKLDMDYFDFDWSGHMPSKKMIKLFGHEVRERDSKAYQYHKDIAAALQKRTEEAVFNIFNAAYKKYKIDNICFAGGVALNSVLNGKILANTSFKKIFIPPDPSDAGAAMGAALYINNKLSNKKINHKEFTPYLGPEYKWYQIKNEIEKLGLKYKYYKNNKQLSDVISQYIIDEKVIGWFQGKMEWGPRALGNRSILASAATTGMRDNINAKVKKREMFRPFAPVILEEKTNEYFKTDKYLSASTKWMLMVYPFKNKRKKDVPAVVHVDGSGRLETLSKDDNSKYYDLINSYYKKSKIPIIINTSFNIRGEPIVCSPKDALNCFLETDIDFIVLDNFVVSK